MNADTGNGIALMADSDNGISVMNYVLRRVVKEYAWTYKMEPDVAGDLFLLAKLKGMAKALAQYDALKQSKDGASPIHEAILNSLGYRLLYGGKEQDAVEVFEKNVREYPQSSNVYDSLGEAYMKIGKKDLAIQNYEKSLQMNPKNNNAVEQLKKLKGEAMHPRVVEQDGFTVIGITARTTNAKEMTPDGAIGKQRKVRGFHFRQRPGTASRAHHLDEDQSPASKCGRRRS